MAGTRILSSLPLQVLVYFNYAFCWLFALLNLAIFAYKGFEFLYPSGVWGWELAFTALYLVIEPVRLFQTSKGNKIEQVGPLVWSVIFSVTIIILHVYYMTEQTYVLRVDYIINTIGLVFVVLEILLSTLQMAVFFYDSR